MIEIVLFIIVSIFVYVNIKKRYTYWSKFGVPCPNPVFAFGNILEALMMSTQLSLLCEKWYNDYPNVPYTGFYKLLSPAINVRDPDLIKDVLIQSHFSFHKNDQNFSKHYDSIMIHNPFVATNEMWKRSRSILTPLLTSFKIRSLHPHLVDSCEKLTNYLRTVQPNQDVEAKQLAVRFIMQNEIRCLFSVDSHCFSETKNAFLELGANVFEPTFWAGIKWMIRDLLPILRGLMPFRFLSARLEKWFHGFVNELKEKRLHSSQKPDDFFQMLLDSNNKYNMSEVELVNHAFSMIIDGYETSNAALGFTIYELARNADIQQNFYEEIINVLAKYDGQLTFEAIQEMEYLDNIIHEAIRLDVVEPLISKICTKKYTLPLIEGQTKPVTIYPGTTIHISTRALHMDPKYYPNPKIFNPNRFTKDERQKRHKGVYLAWGAGPRKCIGINFALNQIKACLISIVRHFKITVSPKQQPIIMDNRTFIYAARDGLLVNFSPRSNEN